MFTIVNLTGYDIMVLVVRSEIVAVGTQDMCEAYAERMNYGTYQINYLDDPEV